MRPDRYTPSPDPADQAINTICRQDITNEHGPTYAIRTADELADVFNSQDRLAEGKELFATFEALPLAPDLWIKHNLLIDNLWDHATKSIFGCIGRDPELAAGFCLEFRQSVVFLSMNQDELFAATLSAWAVENADAGAGAIVGETILPMLTGENQELLFNQRMSLIEANPDTDAARQELGQYHDMLFLLSKNQQLSNKEIRLIDKRRDTTERTIKKIDERPSRQFLIRGISEMLDSGELIDERIHRNMTELLQEVSKREGIIGHALMIRANANLLSQGLQSSYTIEVELQQAQRLGKLREGLGDCRNMLSPDMVEHLKKAIRDYISVVRYGRHKEHARFEYMAEMLHDPELKNAVRAAWRDQKAEEAAMADETGLDVRELGED